MDHQLQSESPALQLKRKRSGSLLSAVSITKEKEKLVPRKYQEEVLSIAKMKNVIAVMDTGTGKTLIATLLIQHVWDQEIIRREELGLLDLRKEDEDILMADVQSSNDNRIKDEFMPLSKGSKSEVDDGVVRHGKKISFFLSPTVPLVHQTLMYLREHLSSGMVIEGFWGDGNYENERIKKDEADMVAVEEDSKEDKEEKQEAPRKRRRLGNLIATDIIVAHDSYNNNADFAAVDEEPVGGDSGKICCGDFNPECLCSLSAMTVTIESDVEIVEDNNEAVPKHMKEREKRSRRGGAPGRVGRGSKFWDRRTWQERLRGADVVVGTAQVLLNVLHHAYWRMDRINLIVFDECHHASKNHPYAQIMKLYAEMPMKDKPKILGLTASPLWNVKESERSLEELQGRLDSEIVGVKHNLDELDEHAPRPSEFLLPYEESPTFPQTKFYRSADESGFDVIHEVNVHREIKRIIQALGPFAADIYIRNTIHSALLKLPPTSQAFEILSLCLSKFVDLADYPQETGAFSPKVLCLVQKLWEYKDIDRFRGIVFVENRMSAFLIVQILELIPELSTWLRVSYLVGHGNTGNSFERLTRMAWRQQEEALRGFRDGEFNLLIATSVAEEGLDVPACKLVIQFDPPKSIKGYVQSRGRAREKNSAYYFMAQRLQSQHVIDSYLSHMRAEPTIRRMFTRPFASNIPQAGLFEERTSWQKHVVPATGARFTYDSAIPLLSQYCDLLPRGDRYASRPRPVYFWTEPPRDYPDQFCVSLTLPSNVPVPPPRRVIEGPPRASERLAKQAVAFMACHLLYNIGAFDDHLLPVRERLGDDSVDADGFRFPQNAKIDEKITFKIENPFGSMWENGQKLYSHILHFTNIGGGVEGRLAFITSRPLELDESLDLWFGRRHEKKLLMIVSVIEELTFSNSEDRQMKLNVLDSFNRRVLWLGITRRPFTTKFSFLIAPLIDGSNTIDWHIVGIGSDVENWPRPTKDDIGKLIVMNNDRASHRLYLLERFLAKGTPEAVAVIPQVVQMKVRKTVELVVTKADPSAGGNKEDGCDEEKVEHFENEDVSELCLVVKTAPKITPIPLQRQQARSIIVFPPEVEPTMSEKIENKESVEGGTLHDVLPKPTIPGGDKDILYLRVLPKARNSMVPHHRINNAPLIPENVEPAKAYLADNCFVSVLPISFWKTLSLVPSFTRAIADFLTARKAAKVMQLPPVKTQLLVQALTLPGCLSGFDYQSMETLGDSFLKLAVSTYLYNKFTHKHEGQLSTLREHSVNNHYLRLRALDINFGSFMISELFRTSKWRPRYISQYDETTEKGCLEHIIPRRALSDCLESTIGAAYLSGGVSCALAAGTALQLCFGGPVPWKERYTHHPIQALPGSVQDADMEKIASLQEILHYKFKDPLLLLQAITHPSYSGSDTQSYQREEWLGDAVVEFYVVQYLYKSYQDISITPGQMTWAKQTLVSNGGLGFIAIRTLRLHNFIRHTSSELAQSMSNAAWEVFTTPLEEFVNKVWLFDPPKTLNDVLEAVVGAVWVDSNYDSDATYSVMDGIFGEYLSLLKPEEGKRDPVSELEVWAAKHGCNQITRVIYPRQSRFDMCTVAITLHDIPISEGRSDHKWIAGAIAAKKALEVFTSDILIDDGDNALSTETRTMSNGIIMKEASKEEVVAQANDVKLNTFTGKATPFQVAINYDASVDTFTSIHRTGDEGRHNETDALEPDPLNRKFDTNEVERPKKSMFTKAFRKGIARVRPSILRKYCDCTNLNEEDLVALDELLLAKKRRREIKKEAARVNRLRWREQRYKGSDEEEDGGLKDKDLEEEKNPSEDAGSAIDREEPEIVGKPKTPTPSTPRVMAEITTSEFIGTKVTNTALESFPILVHQTHDLDGLEHPVTLVASTFTLGGRSTMTKTCNQDRVNVIARERVLNELLFERTSPEVIKTNAPDLAQKKGIPMNLVKGDASKLQPLLDYHHSNKGDITPFLFKGEFMKDSDEENDDESRFDPFNKRFLPLSESDDYSDEVGSVSEGEEMLVFDQVSKMWKPK